MGITDLASILCARWDEEEAASTPFHEADAPSQETGTADRVCCCPCPSRTRIPIAAHRRILADCIGHETFGDLVEFPPLDADDDAEEFVPLVGTREGLPSLHGTTLEPGPGTSRLIPQGSVALRWACGCCT